MKPRRLQLWIPEWGGPGGIQAYSRHLVHACADLCPEATIHVIVRNGPFEWTGNHGGVTGQSANPAPPPLRRAAFVAIATAAVASGRPDLVLIAHLHFTPLARYLQGLHRFRYMVAAHGLEGWGPLTERRRRALAGAEKILPVSHHTANRLRPHLCGTSSFEVFPNTIDETVFVPGPKPFHLLRRYGFSADDQILLTVARLEPEDRAKGCDLVLDAVARLLPEFPRLRYVIAGRGADTPRLARRIRALGLNGSVVLTGFLPSRDLADHHRLADIFVMPSRVEGFGIVFLEALACGRRVIAGSTDGAGEPLLNGKLGVLINPDDPGALTEAIRTAIQTPADPDESAFLRRTMLNHFGPAAFRRRLAALLN